MARFAPHHRRAASRRGGAWRDLSGQRLLLVDDEGAQRGRLARALEAAGLEVVIATTLAEARSRLDQGGVDLVLLDLRLQDGNGLDLVPELRRRCPQARIIVATAFSSIASAVLAIKAGAADYLSKPVDPAVLLGVLQAEPGPAPMPELPMPADRVRWEHIHRVYEQCGRNISETARRLGMHRRSLQRMLAKRAPREQPLARLHETTPHPTRARSEPAAALASAP